MKKNKYNIIYTEMFRKDIKKTFKYICYELDNQNAANRLIDEIEVKIKERIEYPTNFKKVETSNRLKKTWYRINVKNYVIFYTVEENSVIMRRFLYGKRNFKNLL